MLRLIAGFAFAFLVSAADRPSFDIADVHVSPRADWVKRPDKMMQGGYLAGDRYELRRATMLDMIKTAYSVDADKVYGGPSWLDYDRYEVAAKTKPGTRPETLRLMLQTLLEDRFKVAVKQETRDVPGYVLSKGKGELKARPAADVSNSVGCQNQRPVLDGDVRYSSIQCRNVTMAVFGRQLQRTVSSPVASLAVVDATGLEGGWDIDLLVPARMAMSNAPADAGVLEAIDKLGLKLEKGKVPQPVLVVENGNEQPLPNPPGVAAALPPSPAPEFEVASLKWPCESNTGSFSPRFEAAGRVTATCMPLMSLITQAWNLSLYEKPAGIPKWLAEDSTKYNISIFAKAPPNVAPDPQNNAQARDQLNLMLRALLLERYQMKVHYEDRPVDAYTLVAGKPKLTKADPAGRTGCTRQNQQQQGRSLIVKLVCLNMTMAQFAEQLQSYDATFVYPVLDSTGIEGAWDFTLNYDALASLYARFPGFAGRGTAPDGQAADPSGSVSFNEAVEKQLGLKLELRKRPLPVLVIDHMEEKPIEN